MELSRAGYLLIERPIGNLWIGRFTRPDLRQPLDGVGDGDSELYLDMLEAVLEPMRAGEVLILNLGLVYYFPTAFYDVLIQVRAQILHKEARLILCGFSPEIQENIRLFQGDKIFEITHTEEQATRRVLEPASATEFQ